jgi:predicted dithiol-disulfide oxidoreductase (DUF899 family)
VASGKGGLLQLQGAAVPGEEAPGVSVFYKDDVGDVFHTYSTYGRGVEVMMGTYNCSTSRPRAGTSTRPELQDGLDAPPRPL